MNYQNYDKDNLADEIEHFLENHTIIELLEIVKDSIEEELLKKNKNE